MSSFANSFKLSKSLGPSYTQRVMSSMEKGLSEKRRVLICDDSALHRMTLQRVLGEHYECSTSRDAEEALHLLRSRNFHLVLLDISMRSDEEGLEYLPKIRSENPNIGIIISSHHSQFSFVKRALTEGADDYLQKESSDDAVLLSLERVLRLRELAKKTYQQNLEIQNSNNKLKILGKSSAIKELLEKIEKLKRSNVNVVIEGESGTGKELVARALRRQGTDRQLESFVCVDSSTIQSTMAESILFGHVKGAFTGADKARAGLFEEADNGVIYFDEISNMPIEIQRKLLRVIQEKEVTRLGEARPRKLDFRVICATNQDLEKKVKEGAFQFDLLYRLGVVTLKLPPLRERREDIPVFIEQFLSEAPAGRSFVLSAEAMNFFMKYDWPGNVRELANIISFLTTMCDGPIIGLEDLPSNILKNAHAENVPTLNQRILDRRFSFCEANYQKAIVEFEREFMIDAFRKSDGKVAKLARRIGLDRSYLYSKLRTLDLFPIEKLKKEAGL